MKNLLPLIAVVCCSVACAASSAPDSGSRSSAANGNPNGSNDDRAQADDDPSNEEGPTCNDPQAVTPEGWDVVDYGKYSVAIPPHSIVMSSVPDPTVDHVWYIFTDPMKSPVGHVQVAHYAKDIPEAEAMLKSSFPENPITRTTHECHEDLVINFTGVPRNEWHHVDVGGEVVLFGCIDVHPEGDALCTQFINSFHVK